jgi:hypothetical protein
MDVSKASVGVASDGSPGRHRFGIQKSVFRLYDLQLMSKIYLSPTKNTSGHAVAQLIEALRYKPEGRGSDSRWCRRNFSLP